MMQADGPASIDPAAEMGWSPSGADLSRRDGPGEDGALMILIAEGDQDAFTRLVDRHKDALVAYLYRLCGDHGLAEDLSQEAFFRLYRAAGRYQERGRLKAYIYRIATNLLRSHERRARLVRWLPLSPLIEPVAGGAEPESAAEGAELRQALSRAIGELPLVFRAPLVLQLVEGWKTREIAEALRMPEGTVKSRVNRGRRRLRAALRRARVEV